MTEIQEILDRIQRLPVAERLKLDDYLAEQSEAEWQREATVARRIAAQQGIDQAAIDLAVAKVRYPS